MPVDAYMWFQDYNDKYLVSESQVDFKSEPNKAISFPPTPPPNTSYIFEVKSFSFDIEQTLNIGSQSTGAGAGRVSFNPFVIKRPVDKSSPVLFQMACSGTSFKRVTLILRKAAGGASAGAVYLRYTFKLVAVKTIATTIEEEGLQETIAFEYGGMIVEYWPQKPDGSLGTVSPGGWNRVKNVADQNVDLMIT